MTFKEWAGKYYPNETQETLHKMSHAWASAHVSFAMSKGCKNCKEPFNQAIATDTKPCYSCKTVTKFNWYPFCKWCGRALPR